MMDAHATAPIAAAPQRSPARLGIAGDERLARLVGTGSEGAFAVLYERYHQPLYRYCRALLREDADAYDALQAAFTAAFSALRDGRRDAPLKPWLYRIAHNEAISLLRRRRPHEQLDAQAPGTGEPVHEEAERRERLSQLVEDLQRLPVRQRAALVMRELNGLSHQEIALALGTSAGATRQTIFEARRSLLEFAEGRAMSCDEVCRAVSDGDGRSLRSRRVRAHLHACGACAAFAAAIPARRADLKAIAPPLAPLAAAGLVSGLLAGGTSHGGTATTTAGVAGKSALLGVGAKGAVGLAVIAGATVGLTRALPATHHGAHRTVHSHASSAAAPPAAGRVAAGVSSHGTVAVHRRPAGGTAHRQPGTTAAGPGVAAALPPSAAQGHKLHSVRSRQNASAGPHGHHAHPTPRGHRPPHEPARTRAPHRAPQPGRHAAPKAPVAVAPTGGTSAPNAREAEQPPVKPGQTPKAAGSPAGGTRVGGGLESP